MDLKQHGWYLLNPRVTVPKHSFQKILLDISNVKNKLKSYLESYKPDLWKGDQKPKFDKWKKLYKCENLYNRAIFFDGRQWHCSDGGFGDNVKNARLFQTFFFSPYK